VAQGRETKATDIVELLRREPGGVSGATIGRELRLTRAAVWKHVSRLRRNGYEIVGTPSRGYRLVSVPDRLGVTEIRPHLTGEILGREVHWAETVDSTNTWARQLARAGAVEGTVALAEAQTAGRGRLGRSWFSPPGANVYLSIVLRPEVPPARAPQLTLVAGTAVAATIASLVGARPALKWPNDVLLSGAKVAGLLTEMDSEADRVAFVVLGIGVNLNTSAEDLRSGVGATATSILAATGRAVERAGFVGRLLGELEGRYRRYLAEGFAGLREEWESYSCVTGREITVAGPDGERRGRAVGIDADGALLLRDPGGAVLRVLAGDVTVVDGYAPWAGSAGKAGG
jgi:BirA family biotin operon repressor/biotin-[acetyl-CoA-carboxylase] ligase